MLQWNTVKYLKRFKYITAYLREKVAIGLIEKLGAGAPLNIIRSDSQYNSKWTVHGHHYFVTGTSTYNQVLCPGLAAMYCSGGLFPEVIARFDDTRYPNLIRGHYYIQAHVPHYTGTGCEVTDQYGPISMDDVPEVTEFLRTQMGVIWRREGSE